MQTLFIILMKRLFALLTAITLSCNSSQKTINETTAQAETSVDPVALAATITEDELRTHLFTYASDEFEGRETGQPGQKKAVDYIRNHYKSIIYNDFLILELTVISNKLQRVCFN